MRHRGPKERGRARGHVEAGHLTGRVKPTRGATDAPRGMLRNSTSRETHTAGLQANIWNRSFLSFLYFCRHLGGAHLQIESGKSCSDHFLNACALDLQTEHRGRQKKNTQGSRALGVFGAATAAVRWSRSGDQVPISHSRGSRHSHATGSFPRSPCCRDSGELPPQPSGSATARTPG